VLTTSIRILYSKQFTYSVAWIAAQFIPDNNFHTAVSNVSANSIGDIDCAIITAVDCLVNNKSCVIYCTVGSVSQNPGKAIDPT
jgi:hypothetical protein